MRHGKRINHLGRTAPHRKAMLSNMASSLLVNKRINTTLAKAKELRKYVEPLITKAKNDTTHTRRVVFSYLQNKESVQALFNEVVDRVADRPGGYTRIIKLGNRLGDSAEMAMIELVDFNDLLIQEDDTKKGKSRRRRGSKKTKASEEKEVAATAPQEKTDVSPEVEASADEAKEEVKEEKAEEVAESPQAEAKEEPGAEEKEGEDGEDESSKK